MDTRELIIKAFERATAALANAVKDLRPEELKWRPGPVANPIGFILWHVTRGEDSFVNKRIRQAPQVWDEEPWRKRLNFNGNPADTGNSYTPEQVAGFHIPALEDLLAYNQAVRVRTLEYLKGMAPAGLDQTVDFAGRSFTAGDLLVLYIGEINHHIGQIDYIRGLAISRRS
jgi:uncharacterized damage-inducible protein DinB